MKKQQCNNKSDIEQEMKRMNGLSIVISEVRRCGEALITISEKLESLFYGNSATEITSNTEPLTPETPAISLEEVRAICAEKSEEGFDVRALIKKYGAEKLSAVDPEKYSALIAELQGTEK